MATSKRRDEYLKTFEPEGEQEDDDIEAGEQIVQGRAATDAKVGSGESSSEDSAAADSGVTTIGRTGTERDGRRASTAPPKGEGSPGDREEHVTTAVGNAAADGLARQAERDMIEKQLEKEALELFSEMKECMMFHDLY